MNKIVGTLMGLLGKLPAAVSSGNMGKVAELIDEYKLTEQEIAESEVAYEQELTKRLQADMESDNWLSKSVRPIGFLIWTVMILFIIIFDGNLYGFTINKAYLPLVETVYTAFITFYIGSRGIEKAMRTWKKRD